MNNHNVSVLVGLIAFRQGDAAAAHEAFVTAVTQCEKLLKLTPQNYDAADAQGLAFCGLALSGDISLTHRAVTAFQSARASNRDAGLVAQLLRLFDVLALADAAGVLAGVRAAAAGEPPHAGGGGAGP